MAIDPTRSSGFSNFAWGTGLYLAHQLLQQADRSQSCAYLELSIGPFKCGTVEISEDVELLRQIVSDLTSLHESHREAPWSVSESDPHYLDLQLKGIIAVILHVSKVEAKSKISQNKSSEERERIVEDLFTSGIPGEEVIAAEMQRHLNL